jgi:glyoxylate/hydroxypyruvate reductase A
MVRRLPDAELVRPADVCAPQNLRYALTWQPPSGFFAGYPKLALVLTLGAGVDQLLAQ